VKKKLLALLFTAGVSVFGQVSLGIQIGPPPAPRVYERPVAPGPGYAWVDGYWYPVGHHWRWHQGYWTMPAYTGSHWVSPRYEGGRWFDGYWDGERGHFAHEHRWDRDANRFREHDADRHDRDHDRH
jgi:hypothetical protein